MNVKNLIEHQDISFLTKNEISKIQQKLFVEHLIYCKNYSPYYKKVLGNINVDSCSLENIKNLPFTDKEDLQKFNDEFRAVSNNKIVDIVMSSGSTGKPTKIMYTKHDLKRLAYNEKKSFLACGITNDDIVLLTCTIDRCFVAGLAYFSGLCELGAATIRNGHGTLLSHSKMISQHNPTVIVGVPSFIKKLGNFLISKNVNPALTTVKKIVCIGEPLRNDKMKLNSLANDIELMWEAKVFSTYASSECVSTFCECDAQNGGHLLPELAIVEIIDDNGYRVEDGKIGEVVITPLQVEGMPLIRFKTGDISFLINDLCDCGRNSVRLGPIIGRKNQMLKIKGTTVYPQAIFDILSDINFVIDYYIEVDNKDNLEDVVTVFIAIDSKKSDDESLIKLFDILQAGLRVKPNIKIVDNNNIKEKVYTKKSRKPIRFFKCNSNI